MAAKNIKMQCSTKRNFVFTRITTLIKTAKSKARLNIAMIVTPALNTCSKKPFRMHEHQLKIPCWLKNETNKLQDSRELKIGNITGKSQRSRKTQFYCHYFLNSGKILLIKKPHFTTNPAPGECSTYFINMKKQRHSFKTADSSFTRRALPRLKTDFC